GGLGNRGDEPDRVGGQFAGQVVVDRAAAAAGHRRAGAGEHLAQPGEDLAQVADVELGEIATEAERIRRTGPRITAAITLVAVTVGILARGGKAERQVSHTPTVPTGVRPARAARSALSERTGARLRLG